MLKCSSCQTENRDDARFCANCGNRLSTADWATGVTPAAEEARPAEGHPPPSRPPEGGVPVNLRIDYPERLSRLLLFVKWLFVIPALIVVGLSGIAVFITTFISFWAILFTGRYPRWLFDFARGYMEMQARTYAYFPLLLTDQYPLASRPETERDVHYEVEEPEDLSRWLLILKLVTLFMGVVGTLTTLVTWFLILLVAIPVWFVILIMGRIPKWIFKFTVALAQWTARVTAWQWLMRDEWSLFATTRPVAFLVGVGAVLAVSLQVASCSSGVYG